VSSVGSAGLVLIFLAAAGATWVAGLYLSKATDVIDDRFKLGDAVGGMILLGVAGTLPEIAITVSAALSGDLSIAVGNLLGGIAIQTCVLVVLDATSRRRTPLTSLSTTLSPIFEAVLVLIVVSIGLMGAYLPPSKSIGVVSPASLGIVVVWLAGMFLLNRARKREHWQLAATASPAPAEPAEQPSRSGSHSTRAVLGIFLAASLVTLVAGVMLEQSGNQLADHMGVNGAVFGATFLAAVTALPEISTGIEAVRLGDVGLAMGDIFGGNAVQMTLFLVADLLAQTPVLPTASAQSLWLAALGVVVTGIYVAGLVGRPERKVGRFVGPDSLAVVVIYGLGIIGLTMVPG
jgi:cation:H+ antiporter